MKQKILSETPINMAEVKEGLRKISERDKDLNFRAQKTAEYLDQNVRLELKKTRDLLKKLEKLEIPRLREMHLHKIVDLLPEREDDLKMIMQSYNVTVTKENLKKIVDVVVSIVPSEA